MKTKISLFILLLMVVSPTVWAKSITGLNPGDYVVLETTAVGGEQMNVPWTYEQVSKAQFVLRLTEKTKDKLHFSLRLKRLFYNFTLKEDAHYFDSDFFSLEYPLKSLLADSVRLSVDLNTHTVMAEDFEQDIVNVSVQYVPVGLIKEEKDMQFINRYLNKSFKVNGLVEEGITPFMKEWERNFPSIVNYKQSDDMIASTGDRVPISYEATVRAVEASFQLPPNVHILYQSKESTDDEGLTLLYVNRQGYDPASYTVKRVDENTTLHTCFIPDPTYALLHQANLALTPGDSIVIREEGENVSIEGLGAGNSRYASERMTMWRFFYEGFYEMRNPQQKNEFIRQSDSIYQALLEKHGAAMNDYWRRSLELSNAYTNATMMISSDYRKVDWTWEGFKKLYPFMDYWYNPLFYVEHGGFLHNYQLSLNLQNTPSNVLRDIHNEAENNTYYTARMMFSGFPQEIMMYDRLGDMLNEEGIKKMEKEYREFMRMSKNPLFAGWLEERRNQLAPIEPGEKLDDIFPHIPYSKEKRTYTLMYITTFGENKEQLTYFLNDVFLKYAQIDSTLSFRILFPEGLQSYYGENINDKMDASLHEPIYYLPDWLFDEFNKQTDVGSVVFLVRDDGKILFRHLGIVLGLQMNLEEMIQTDKNTPDPQDTAQSGILWVIIGLVSLVALVAIIRMYRARKKSRQEAMQRKISELELQAVRAQMNPHFIFNALTSVQNLIAENKNEQANEYLVSFATLLRSVLRHSDKELISLADEISQLEIYLKLEQLRVPFTYAITVAKNMDIDYEEIPGMLVQPIAENAVKHGIVPFGGGEMQIDFSKDASVLTITVSDTGKGYSAEEKHQGFGVRAVKERLELLNRDFGNHIGITTEKTDKWFSVKIHISL